MQAEPRRQGLVWPWIVVAAALILSVVALWRRAAAPQIDNPLASAAFIPLTDYEGTEVDASISPDGKFVVFLSDRDGPFHVWLDQIGAGNPIDLTPGPDDQRGPLRSVGFSHDGTEIWLSGTQVRRFQLLPVVGGKPRMFLGEGVAEAAWSPDGARMAYHKSESGDPIFVANGDGSNPRQIWKAQPDKHNHYLAWGAGGNWIYYVHGTAATNEMDLWRVSQSGDEPEQLTHQATEMRDPTPLGKETILYLARERDGSGPWIWAYDLPHKISRRILFGLERYTSLSASDDGKRLAVTAANPTVRLLSVPILTSTATETDVKPFLPASMQAMSPRFRGNALYYLSSAGPSGRLWRFEEGKAVEVWRGQENRILEPPAVSPDGRRIAIVINQAGKRRLQLITADGAESSSIAQAIEVEGSMDWSPDGHWIVTGGNDAKGEGLFKIPVAGGAPVRLTNTVGRNPVWSPDGSIIVYSGPNTFALTPLLAIRSDGTALKNA